MDENKPMDNSMGWNKPVSEKVEDTVFEYEFASTPLGASFRSSLHLILGDSQTRLPSGLGWSISVFCYLALRDDILADRIGAKVTSGLMQRLGKREKWWIIGKFVMRNLVAAENQNTYQLSHSNNVGGRQGQLFRK